MDTVHEVAESRTPSEQLSTHTHLFILPLVQEYLCGVQVLVVTNKAALCISSGG